MQINSVPAGAGLRWLVDSMRLFRRQPLGLPAMVVVYSMLLLVPAMIPAVGIAISGILGPFATVGLMQCFRDADHGRAPTPAAFAQPFTNAQQRVNLFRLGAINAGLLMLVVLAATLVAPAPASDPAPQSFDDLPLQPLLVQMLFYAPVMVLMWFAPLLAGWHGATPGKAMFGSVVACGRNLGALTLYAMAAVGLVTASSFFAIAVLTALVPRDVLGFLAAPLVLVLTTVVQGSFYPMYLSIFTAQSVAEQA